MAFVARALACSHFIKRKVLSLRLLCFFTSNRKTVKEKEEEEEEEEGEGRRRKRRKEGEGGGGGKKREKRKKDRKEKKLGQEKEDVLMGFGFYY